MANSTLSVIGIDVGGTNTDIVYLQNNRVVSWHKTPTTWDIQSGVETAIEAIIDKGNISHGQVDSVKIGTTQFVNAVLEQDASKLDKVAVIRLCGPYSQGSPPFGELIPHVESHVTSIVLVSFPKNLRKLVEGHFGYVNGGFEVDGREIMPLDSLQLRAQAAIIRSKSIKSVVIIGIYSPANPIQEAEAQTILLDELGPGYDISCSHAIGRLGFLERENASILNGSLRRFARHVIAGLSYATRNLGKCRLYITLNDGTLSIASTAATYPVLYFRSGPTNSARGATLLAKTLEWDEDDDREVLVADVGGTTTDICALLNTGYPRQSAAFVEIAGVRTNFTIPDVHSVALGGGSIVRSSVNGKFTVGPDSVGARLNVESISFGGHILTANDLAIADNEEIVSVSVKSAAQSVILKTFEEAVDVVKTKQDDARLILVGGGSSIIGSKVAGIGEILRPKYLEVANAVGAAIGRISGSTEKTVVPTEESNVLMEIEAAKLLAIERCVNAGGARETISVLEIDVTPVTYTMNGATTIFVRVVGDLANDKESMPDFGEDKLEDHTMVKSQWLPAKELSSASEVTTEVPSHEDYTKIDLNTYRPRILGDFWYLSELDVQFLSAGTGVLGVGSCGEPYPSFLALREILRKGGELKIRRQSTFPEHGVALVCGFMGAPSVYNERIPGEHEVTDAVKAVMQTTGLEKFDCTIPNEIGGLNAFEALLAAYRLNTSTLDTDLVARAYPMIYHTIRCLHGVSVTPAALANGKGRSDLFTVHDMYAAESQMRSTSVDLGSLCGVCINPVPGTEVPTLPSNSFSYAWSIGRGVALAQSLKQDPLNTLLKEHNGVLLFTGRIISVVRDVAKGFTRGNVTIAPISEDSPGELYVEFENENLSAVLDTGSEKRVMAVCPDLIQFLDLANGAALGVADYKYGLRVYVIALASPPQWLTEKGLAMGGPTAFGIDMKYSGVSTGIYEPPKSVWELYGESTGDT